MGTVLSHIIQTRYSKEFENIATDALIFVLKESKKAKAEMVNVLRSLVPTLPDLEFYSQGQKQNTRPDICGKSNNKELVYIENKFWAGLTKNQPVTYLQNLSKSEPETLLLFVVPGLREQAMKGELARKLKVADIGFNTKENLPTGIVWAGKTDLGPTLALTSWQRLIKI